MIRRSSPGQHRGKRPFAKTLRLDTPQSLLRDLADKAAARFGAQLIIIQAE
jgi:hypothetical protein